MSSAPPRSIVYIDGFNLFFGALKGTRHRWLDLESFFRRLRPDDDIRRIRYFSALVTGTKQDPDKGERQEAYLDALSTTPLVDVHLGRFKTTWIKCRVPDCGFEGERMFPKPKEKRTDVSIALHMLDDALSDRTDRLVVVSGDSDLVPAIDLVKHRRPEKEVIVYVPSERPYPRRRR